MAFVSTDHQGGVQLILQHSDLEGFEHFLNTEWRSPSID